MQRAAQTVKVGAEIHIPQPPRLLRADKMWRPHDVPGQCYARRAFAEKFRQPEVAQLHRAVLGEENIVRLHVAMDELRRLPRVIQGAGDVIGHIQRFGERQPPAAAQTVLNGLALHEFHRDVFDALALPGREDLHDVRMIQAGRRHRLSLEAREITRVTRHVRRQNFQGHRSLEGNLPRLIDCAHAAATDLGDDFITGKLLTCCK